MSVYRNQKGTLSWAGSDRAYRRGEIIVDPPEHILEKFGDDFERLDDPKTGAIDRDILEGLKYRTLQRIAASDLYDAVDGNSTKAAILEAVSAGGNEGDDSEGEPTDE
ncbi:hypothetical protein HTZ84_05190 [Haloterrigena sp. SYSU A558-1]|uniref:Uncharacterized protein n=1 Tax=Haloterrigena gelatinilytica TaxID=2741724 RepID=A0ABX2L9Z3_9EURY|nr:hypothetical protein [Haloterrigena gelatinilytica]NUC71708.1 hypothetical protein [Haloterrigena gelatinilytica]